LPTLGDGLFFSLIGEGITEECPTIDDVELPSL
jgi:hypothetical protein